MSNNILIKLRQGAQEEFNFSLNFPAPYKKIFSTKKGELLRNYIAKKDAKNKRLKRVLGIQFNIISLPLLSLWLAHKLLNLTYLFF